jgi:hypothetical protein
MRVGDLLEISSQTSGFFDQKSLAQPTAAYSQRRSKKPCMYVELYKVSGFHRSLEFRIIAYDGS